MKNPIKNIELPCAANFFPEHWSHSLRYPNIKGYGSIEQPILQKEFTLIEQIERAEAFLRQQGCQLVFAPLGKTTWGPYRVVRHSSQRPKFFNENVFEGSSQIWLDAGYTLEQNYTSTLAKHSKMERYSKQKSLGLLEKGWRMTTLADFSIQDVLRPCYGLIERAFANALCFQPVTFAEFSEQYTPVLQRVDPRLVLMVWSPDNVLAGFCLSYPDILNPTLKQVVIKSLAVDPDFACLGLGSWMVGQTHQIALRLGWDGDVIYALMAQSSHSQSISAHAGDVFREYGLYSKLLY